MKYVFLIALSAGILAACNSTDTKSGSLGSLDATAKQKAIKDSANYTTLQWLDSTHQEFGKVQEGQILDISWRFKNTGSKPLVITDASASCGCTVAEKPEQPIAPGEDGVIKAKFNSNGHPGDQRKQVFVTANTKGTSYHQLSFHVEVDKK